MTRAGGILTGCAGWSLSAEHKPRFPGSGTHLERYARVFPLVEINSSFYRPHQAATYRRWADSVPGAFRFTAKVPKDITHVLRLRGAEERLDRFLSEVTHLGEKLGALLVQLPPSLGFAEGDARAFLSAFRNRFQGRIAWEARHATWFTSGAEALLREFQAAVVAADPPVAGSINPLERQVGDGPQGFGYFRLHGSPRMYYSAYSREYLESLSARLQERAQRAGPEPVYCVFDNTAEGAAVSNALELQGMVA